MEIVIARTYRPCSSQVFQTCITFKNTDIHYWYCGIYFLTIVSIIHTKMKCIYVNCTLLYTNSCIACSISLPDVNSIIQFPFLWCDNRTTFDHHATYWLSLVPAAIGKRHARVMTSITLNTHSCTCEERRTTLR